MRNFLLIIFLSLSLLTAGCFDVGSILAASPSTGSILIKVPFTSQAPTKEWQNPRFQDACEEASILMAMRWVKGQSILLDNKSVQKTKREILDLSAYQEKAIGTYHDTSASTTAKWLLGGYYKYNNYEVKKNITVKDIIKNLEQGNIIIVPTNGRLLKNPNFSGLGPERHMVLIKGYDYRKKLFITNDPGTRNGENYKYSEKILYQAIRDYPTGYHVPIKNIEKTAIIIKK